MNIYILKGVSDTYTAEEKDAIVDEAYSAAKKLIAEEENLKVVHSTKSVAAMYLI